MRVKKPCINTTMLHKNDSNSILSIPALIWVLDDDDDNNNHFDLKALYVDLCMHFCRMCGLFLLSLLYYYDDYFSLTEIQVVFIDIFFCI